MMQSLQNKAFYPWLVWGLGASFFFSEYFARVAPSIMVPQLMQAFSVGALHLGIISSAFYYAYISMQLVVGLSVDRFGAARLLMATALLCAIGCLLFSFSTHLFLATFSRFLMGLGAAFAFVGTLKLATLWFKPRRFGLLAGLTQALGMLGAAVGTGALSMVVTRFGWRATMVFISLILFFLALMMRVLVSDKVKKGFFSSATPSLMHALQKVIKNPQSWWNALAAGFLYAPTAAFAELWGPSYLVKVYHVHAETAATGISAIFIGWAMGGPVLGALSDHMGRRQSLVLSSSLMSLFFMAIILYVPDLTWTSVVTLLFLYGVSNTGVATTYAIASEINERTIAGTSVAFTYMCSILVGALLQPIIGWCLEFQWSGHLVAGVPDYSVEEFKRTLLLLPLFCLFAVLFSLFIKETYCRPLSET